MNKTVKYALSAVMAFAMVAPVLAQDNFQDVAESHWAYNALQRMKKEGVLVGYPDGLFRGTRPATRYEMAVAINAAYQNLRQITDGLDSAIKAMNGGMSGNPSDLSDMRAQLKDAQAQLDGMKSYGQDIADLKRMAADYEKELTAMGADVKDMKDQLSSLDKRVTALEAKQLPFNVHGDASAVVLGGYSGSGGFGVTVDGRPTGFGRGGYAGLPVGANRDFTVLHEASVELTSNNDSGPKFDVVGVAGNMIGGGTGFGTQGHISQSPFIESNGDFYFQKLAVMFGAKAAGLGLSAEVGRIGVKVSPYIFQRPDVTPYFANDRWDNGEWALDGGKVSFGLGKGSVDVIVGRTSDIKDSAGIPLQGLTAGQFAPAYTQGGNQPIGEFNTGLAIDQILGVTAGVSLGSFGKLDLAYLFLDSNTTVNGANRVNVYGGDITTSFKSIGIDAGYSKSDLKYNNTSINNSNDARYNVGLTFDVSKLKVKAGYKYIEPLYAAPGDWGRIGVWYNPTDIKGFEASLGYDLSNKLALNAAGSFLTGTGKIAGGLGTGDKINTLSAGVDYKINDDYKFSLGYEYDQWNVAALGSKPVYQWINVGLGYNLSTTTNLSVLWQISNYDSKGATGFTVFGQPTAKGGLITTQLSIKF